MNYEQRIVAFIDLLGFKNLVKEAETDNVLLNNINSLLEYLSAWTTGQQNKWDSRFIQNVCDAQKNKASYEVNRVFCSCCSDSLAVSIPYDHSLINQHFSTFISNLADIGSRFIQAGILIRGGITVGNLVHTENIIFGPAMNEAVEIEKDKAIYPRIILSKDLIRALQFPPNPVYPYRKFLTRFNDGCVGFHQMKHFEYQHLAFTNEVERARGELIENLDEQLCNPKVFDKYKWLTDEFNKLNIANPPKIKTDLTDGGQKPYNIYYEEINEQTH